MKNYNKILEAINRGIQLALDDFGDDQIQNVKSKQVQNRDYTKEYLDLMKDVVDLGLPSGTLWCKYNLGATCEPNNNRSWFGDYYAWGEIKTKLEFSWSTYKYAEHYTDLSKKECLTKYCNDPKYGLNGFTDNLIQLLPEDDAAYQNKKLYNFKFYIPTKEQCEELLKYTNKFWVNNYDPNKLVHNSKNDEGIQGLNGVIFEGKNGNQMFIPAAGYHDGNRRRAEGFNCVLYAGTLDISAPHKACGLYFSSFKASSDPDYRYYGFSIRPIINL